MRFRLFPVDLEGVGCYRIVYPYGFIDARTNHSCIVETQGDLIDDQGNTKLPLPKAAIGGEYDVDAAMFLDSDVYVIQRPLDLPYAPLCAWLAQEGRPIVIDLDDWMHGIPSTNQGGKNLLKEQKKGTRGNLSRLEVLNHCLRYASVLTVTTERLAELYAPKFTNIHIIPNFVHYADFKDIVPSYEKDREKIRIGWMGWMGWRSHDLKILKPVLQKFLRRHPECVFVNVGKPDAVEYLQTRRDQTLHVQGERFPYHFEPTSEIDIGLVPLTRNDFNESKSYLKGMEYGAVGAAVVASPTGPYKEWVTEGDNGYLARTTEEWIDSLEDLVKDDVWRHMARRNREKTMENLIEDNYQRWFEPFQKR